MFPRLSLVLSVAVAVVVVVVDLVVDVSLVCRYFYGCCGYCAYFVFLSGQLQ